MMLAMQGTGGHALPRVFVETLQRLFHGRGCGLAKGMGQARGAVRVGGAIRWEVL